MLEMFESEAKRVRRKAPKVRTGCNTCRVRRVKCDETKPECLRCQKFGVGRCDGYLRPSKPEKGELRSINRPLKPASFHQPHAGPRFNDNEEYQCFNLFKSYTIPHLAGPFSDTLWGRIISQASQDEPFVLDCLIAIGGLSRVATLPQACPIQGAYSTTYGNQAYEFSLKQYGKALKAMRDALSNGKQNLRRTLIACLLVFCFESYIGNQVAAITHAQSGISLLYQSKSSKRQSSARSSRLSAVQNVEDEVVQAFGRLDLQISIIQDMRPLEFHQKIKDDCFADLQDMPTSFQTLAEARIWCELLMRWNYHFRAESATVGKVQENDMKCPPIVWEDSMDTPMGATVLHDPKEIPMALLPEYRVHVSKTILWSEAFQPIFKTLSKEELSGGTLLQVQAKMSSITLASAFFTLETGYDFFLPEFRDIITLADSISVSCPTSLSLLTGAKSRLSYHFDGGFVPALFLVATKCRDRVLRRRAIDLLSAAPLREGVFDSICVAKLAEWIVAVEEEGIEEGEIPDHRRLRIRRSNIDLPMRRAQLHGTQFRNADDVEPEWKETVLVW